MKESSYKVHPDLAFQLTIPEFDLVLKEGQQITRNYTELETIQVEGIWDLDSTLNEIPLTEEQRQLVEQGYELDSSIEAQPVFKNIFNILERQTHTKFFLKRDNSEQYTLKYGEYTDPEGETLYGWYLEDVTDNSFTLPLTKYFVLSYIADKSFRE